MTEQASLPAGPSAEHLYALPLHPPEPLFGRGADLEAVQLPLKDRQAVLLYGTTGIGKTALAARLALQYGAVSTDVLWLEAADDSLDALLLRTAREYELDFDAATMSQADRIEAVRSVLRDQAPLVVIDGEIDPASARRFVEQCADDLPVIVTAPQPITGPWSLHAVNRLDADDAKAMLIHISGEALASTDPRVTELSGILAGHPLLITITGRQLGVTGVTPAAFIQRIPDMPAGEINHALAILMANYRLLPASLQGILLLLGSSFAGSATPALLAETTGAPVDVMTANLRELHERGLVYSRRQYEQDTFGTHELVQMFVHSFLSGKHQLEPMQARHMEGLLGFLDARTSQVDPDSQDQIAAEVGNILAAATFAAQDDQPDHLRRLAVLLSRGSDGGFATTRDFHPELRWIQYLADHPEAADQPLLSVLVPDMPQAEPTGLPGRTIEPGPEEATEPVVEAIPAVEDLLPQPGAIAEDLLPTADEADLSEPAAAADAPPAPTSIPESLSEPPAPLHKTDTRTDETDYQADGNIDDELAALETLARQSLEAENYEDVLAYIDQGMAIAEDAHNPRREAELLTILGDLQVMLHHDEGAESAYKEAIAALTPDEAWLEIALIMDKLGYLYVDQDRHTDAIKMWEQTVSIFERENQPNYMRDSYHNLSDAYAEMLQWSRAQLYQKRAVEQAQALNNDEMLYVELSRLGELYEASGQRDLAAAVYQRALDVSFRLDDQSRVGQNLLALARLWVDDTVQLNRVVQLLKAASQRLPDNADVRRLLSRAEKRQERLAGTTVTLLPPYPSLTDYAKPDTVTES